MGDDEASFALHQLVHGFLNEHFGTGVNRAGGFIQNGNTTLLSSKADGLFYILPNTNPIGQNHPLGLYYLQRRGVAQLGSAHRSGR